MIKKVKRQCLICGHNWIEKSNSYYPVCPICHKNYDFGDNVQCQLCGVNVFTPDIHHKDGHPENNNPKNRMALCRKCHSNIHMHQRYLSDYKRKFKTLNGSFDYNIWKFIKYHKEH